MQVFRHSAIAERKTRLHRGIGHFRSGPHSMEGTPLPVHYRPYPLLPASLSKRKKQPLVGTHFGRPSTYPEGSYVHSTVNPSAPIRRAFPGQPTHHPKAHLHLPRNKPGTRWILHKSPVGSRGWGRPSLMDSQRTATSEKRCSRFGEPPPHQELHTEESYNKDKKLTRAGGRVTTHKLSSHFRRLQGARYKYPHTSHQPTTLPRQGRGDQDAAPHSGVLRHPPTVCS